MSEPTVKHTPLNELPKSEKFWKGGGSNSEIELLKQILEQLKILNENLSGKSEETINKWSTNK